MGESVHPKKALYVALIHTTFGACLVMWTHIQDIHTLHRGIESGVLTVLRVKIRNKLFIAVRNLSWN